MGDRPVGRSIWVGLEKAARKARERAYAPYSGFRVGAAVLASSGVHTGCNVENASFGLTVCAERNAAFAAVVAGADRIEAVAVVSDGEAPTPPCGACLQVLVEFSDPELPIVLYGSKSGILETTLGELMPRAFGEAHLRKTLRKR